jgi:hypothetical protein
MSTEGEHLATIQEVSRRSCKRLTVSSFFVICLYPAVNAKFVPKFQVALHASIKIPKFKFIVVLFQRYSP